MTWAPDYVDLSVAKTYLKLDEADEIDDTFIAIALSAASRGVDHACNRQFGQLASPAAFYYDGPRMLVPSPRPAPGHTALWGDRTAVEIDDLMTTSGLVVEFADTGDGTYPTTITDYDLWPWNAPTKGKPWTHLVFRDTISVPRFEKAVKVTASFGWTSIPLAVTQAVLFQTNRWIKRRDAAFGVAGSPELGNELRLLAKLDADVEVLVAQLNRPWAAA